MSATTGRSRVRALCLWALAAGCHGREDVSRPDASPDAAVMSDASDGRAPADVLERAGDPDARDAAASNAPDARGATDARPDGPKPDGPAATPDAAAADRPMRPPGACVPEGARMHALLPAVLSTAPGAVYNSQPPSSGQWCRPGGRYGGHYGARTPLPHCNLVRTLRHGGVALVYNCAPDCPEIVQRLVQVMKSPFASDATCQTENGVARVLITADPGLDTRVAAVGYGWTWRSDCLDDAAQAELTAFVEGRLGKGDSDECKNENFAGYTLP